MDTFRTLILVSLVIATIPKQLQPPTVTNEYFESSPTLNYSYAEYLPSIVVSTSMKHHFDANSKPKNTASALLLILLSGDIACNPGPIKYPCMICDKAVRWRQQAICCDSCDRWCHSACIEMPPSIYSVLENHMSYSWICCTCGLPNFASCLFNTTTLSLSNSFAPLSSSFVSIDSSVPTSPQCTSSPISHKKEKTRTKPNLSKPAIRTLVMNARSIRGKADQLQLQKPG